MMTFGRHRGAEAPGLAAVRTFIHYASAAAADEASATAADEQVRHAGCASFMSRK